MNNLGPQSKPARSTRQWMVLAVLIVSGAILVLEIWDMISNFAEWKRGGGEGSWTEQVAESAALLIGWAVLAFWLEARRRSGWALALTIGTTILCAMMWIGQRG